MKHIYYCISAIPQFFKFIFKSSFIYFISGYAGSSLPHRLFSSCGEQGLLSLVAMSSLVAEHGFEVHRLQYLQLTGSIGCSGPVAVACRREWAQQLWCRGLEASWTRDQTCVPCIDRWVLIHCTTREVPVPQFLTSKRKIKYLQSPPAKTKNQKNTHKLLILTYIAFLRFLPSKTVGLLFLKSVPTHILYCSKTFHTLPMSIK